MFPAVAVVAPSAGYQTEGERLAVLAIDVGFLSIIRKSMTSDLNLFHILQETYQTVNLVLNLIATLSTLGAVYGLGLFYEMSIRPLRKFYVRPKFTAIRLLIILTNLQKVLFSVFSRFGVIKCLPPLPCDSEFTVNGKDTNEAKFGKLKLKL